MTTTETISTHTVTIPGRFCGPPGMGNGGWVAGTLAAFVGTGPVQVTLRAPAPLDRPLTAAVEQSSAALWDGEVLIAEAMPTGTIGDVPPFVPIDAALVAQDHFAGFDTHPFPTCFVCGTERRPDDALRIFAGPVASRDDLVASVWTPNGPTADGHHVDTAAVWAALDCPTGWVHYEPGGAAVLGRVTVEVADQVRLGEPHVIVATRGTVEGRKLSSTAALYDADGRRLAASRAVWITLV